MLEMAITSTCIILALLVSSIVLYAKLQGEREHSARIGRENARILAQRRNVDAWNGRDRINLEATIRQLRGELHWKWPDLIKPKMEAWETYVEKLKLNGLEIKINEQMLQCPEEYLDDYRKYMDSRNIPYREVVYDDEVCFLLPKKYRPNAWILTRRLRRNQRV